MSTPDIAVGVTSDEPPQHHRGRHEDDEELLEGRRPRKVRVVVATVVVIILTGAAITTVMVVRNRDAAPVANSQPAIATAPIVRGDVVDTESVEGTLTYANERSLPAAASGMVTWVPAEGAAVGRNNALLRVADKPVVLLYGSLPVYRAMRPGTEGPDVAQLESNLKALGYAGSITVDDEYTSATASAVREWQEDLGLEETGVVDAAQVVYASGPVRVGDVAVSVGQQVGGATPALTVTDTKPIVHVALDAAKQDFVVKGDRRQVTMPGGKKVTGTVTAVGSVAKTDDKGKSTISVDIELEAGDASKIDQASVTVDLVSARAGNVLSVPVEALLGLREGGFGVQVVENGTTRIVAVTTGTYGGGRVEISGSGLREGMAVGVPRS